MKPTKFTHNINKKTYVIIEEDIKVQVNNVWVDAIRYQREHEPFQSFVRPREEFFAKFTPIVQPIITK